MSNLSGYIFLFLGIVLGITSNGFLKSTNGFTNLGPTIFVDGESAPGGLAMTSTPCDGIAA